MNNYFLISISINTCKSLNMYKEIEYLGSKWKEASFNTTTAKPLLRGQTDEWQPPLESPHVQDSVNLNINVLIFTPDARPPLLKSNIFPEIGLASQS